MLLQAITIFVSSFLLFLIQPILAKLILPTFGGSAAVWTTCLVFFNVILLLGYGYAHWLTKRSTHLHLGVLGIAILLLPWWGIIGSAPSNPSVQILLTLTFTIGVPYFALCATSPLIQHWRAHTFEGRDAYRLFALSNFASMLALMGYPSLVEPFVPGRLQLRLWSLAYVIFAILCATAALRSKRAAPEAEPVHRSGNERPRLFWLGMSAMGSILLLSVTNHICQNIASIPLLWMVPLILYLVTFIACFEGSGWYKRSVILPMLGVVLVAMSYFFVHSDPANSMRMIPLFAAGLFVCCMFFHGELAASRPSREYLTEFYLMVSLGGTIGAILVGVVAPNTLKGVIDLPVALALTAMIALFRFYRRHWATDIAWAGVAIAVLVYSSTAVIVMSVGEAIGRNFYGGLRVVDQPSPNGRGNIRILAHGVVNHGAQLMDASLRQTPTTYFTESSGAGIVLRTYPDSPRRVGIIGLGAGTLATYGRQGDEFRFFEINPLVVDFAKQYFTFLSDTKAQVDVVVGDGRLALETTGGKYDVFIVDAFSGDAIPVHLLTREAFDIYRSHLKPNGVLALHISNHNLVLIPVVKKLADITGQKCIRIISKSDPNRFINESEWAVVGSEQALARMPDLAKYSQPLPDNRQVGVWTDDFNNLFEVLK